MTGGKIDSPRVINIPLQPLEPGASVVLKNIFFDLNKFTLRDESAAELDVVISLMKENPNLKVEIIGHTDKVGKDADNLTLSMNRARSVVDYLVAGGLDKTRFAARGYGSSQPVSSNDTEEGRALNRRTELKVISN
jgi:outer membrane protein OmpA-like peptidoglycan-associated protein